MVKRGRKENNEEGKIHTVQLIRLVVVSINMYMSIKIGRGSQNNVH